MSVASLTPRVLRVLGAGMLIMSLSGAVAAEAELTTRAVGSWDLRLDDGSRVCRLMLRAEPVPPGYAIGAPPGCHRAFPFLSTVKMWTDVGDGRLQFQNRKGQAVLVLEPGQDGVLAAIGPEGEALRLAPVGQHRETALKGEAPVEPAKSAPASAEARRSSAQTPAEMAGHYSVLRKLGKDTGCMVTLDEKARGPGGALKANLAPACRDQGIVIFDPVGWQLQAGRLVLTARKGHTTRFDLQSDGVWTKDAKEGGNLSLKKM